MRIVLFLISIMFLSSCSKKLYFEDNKETIKFKNTDSHISVNLKINQYNKGNFYFDTGSAWLIIDDTYYKNQKMSFENSFESEMGGVGNGLTTTIRILDTINFAIENHNFYSEYNITNDLKKIFGEKIDGIVGFHNFRNVPFKVDYVAQKITLNPEVEDNYEEIAIEFDGYRMYLPIELRFSNGNTIKGNFLIDTGASGTVLTRELLSIDGFTENQKAAYINNGGIGGVSQGYTFFVPELRIGKHKLTNRLIDISIDTLGGLSKDESYIGIVCNDVLNYFDIVYYSSKNKILLFQNLLF